MDKFGTSDLRQLTEVNQGPCVTICMPTHVTGADGQQDAIRLKNLAERVEQQLADGWLRAPEARDMLKALRELPGDHDFWGARSHGMALFLDHGSLKHFRVPMQLNELALVNRRFHVKPLLPLLTGGARFFLLALSQHSVRLFESTEYQIEQIDVAGLPQRMEAALNLDGADRGSQSHFAIKGGKGRQSSVFHGQGGVPNSHKDDLAQFFRLIEVALRPVLHDETVPLVLAGVDYLLPIFRSVCNYAHLAKPELAGNCDHLSARQIQEKVWPLVEPLLIEAREKAAAKYRQLAGTGKTSDNIRHALPAAFEGRIEMLFVASDHHLWGVCDEQGRVIDTHNDQQPTDDDLLDTAAVQTLLHRGSIYVVERRDVPSSEPLAAVLRF